jgi:hypothetical protein
MKRPAGRQREAKVIPHGESERVLGGHRLNASFLNCETLTTPLGDLEGVDARPGCSGWVADEMGLRTDLALNAVEVGLWTHVGRDTTGEVAQSDKGMRYLTR